MADRRIEPDDLWSPFEPVSGNAGWGEYWLHDGHHWKRVRSDYAARIVRVDHAAFDAVDPPTRPCRAFGSFGERGGRLTAGMHPCGDPRCEDCAIQWAALLLAHLYVTWRDLGVIWVYEGIPRANLASLTRSIRRSGGEYFAVHRDATDEHYVFASTPPGPRSSLGEHARKLTASNAWLHARDDALRLPFVTEPGWKRIGYSNRWKPRKPAPRDATFGTGLEEHEVLGVPRQVDDHAHDAHGKRFEDLPQAERHAIGLAVDVDIKSARGVTL